MSAAVAFIADEPVRHPGWTPISGQAPQLAETAWAYLDQMALSLRPASIDAADIALRALAGFFAERTVLRFAEVDRGNIEAFTSWLAVTPTSKGTVPSRNTIRLRLGIVRSLFDRVIEWGWADAPARTPMFAIDVPVADDPLPRFLDDAQAARLMAAAAKAAPLDRLVIELLARTGRRVGELCDLDADAVEKLSGAWWLRIPLGKLRNDRYGPLHPSLVELLTTWPAGHRFPIEIDGAPIDRHKASRSELPQIRRWAVSGSAPLWFPCAVQADRAPSTSTEPAHDRGHGVDQCCSDKNQEPRPRHRAAATPSRP